MVTYVLPGTPRPSIYKSLFQLDDEPNLYIENGCFIKHPFINGWPWGSRLDLPKNHPGCRLLENTTRMTHFFSIFFGCRESHHLPPTRLPRCRFLCSKNWWILMPMPMKYYYWWFGRNPVITSWYGSYPIIYKVSKSPQVVQDFWTINSRTSDISVWCPESSSYRKKGVWKYETPSFVPRIFELSALW